MTGVLGKKRSDGTADAARGEQTLAKRGASPWVNKKNRKQHPFQKGKKTNQHRSFKRREAQLEKTGKGVNIMGMNNQGHNGKGGKQLGPSSPDREKKKRKTPTWSKKDAWPKNSPFSGERKGRVTGRGEKKGTSRMSGKNIRAILEKKKRVESEEKGVRVQCPALKTNHDMRKKPETEKEGYKRHRQIQSKG